MGDGKDTPKETRSVGLIDTISQTRTALWETPVHTSEVLVTVSGFAQPYKAWKRVSFGKLTKGEKNNNLRRFNGRRFSSSTSEGSENLRLDVVDGSSENDGIGGDDKDWKDPAGDGRGEG